jgi:hypothetical protein
MFECKISYQKDITSKIIILLQISGVLSNIQTQSPLKACNISVTPLLLYGCEMWTLKQRNMRRLNTAEMKFIRRRAGYRLLQEMEDILVEEKLE